MSCFQSWSKSGAWGLAAVSLAALAACGGGGGGDANAATPSNFAQGSIEGFGSIIVNGVRYDETQARVSSDEGATLASEALKLGMVVEVLASAPGRIDLELRESAIDAESGQVAASTRRIIVGWTPGEDGAPPQTVSVTPAA